MGLVKRIVMREDKRHIYELVTDPKVIKNIILSSINIQIQLFSEALGKIENEIRAGGDDLRYLLKRAAALRISCEQEKNNRYSGKLIHG